jgi:NADH-quinone oxidoreductase subunit K
MFNAVNITFVTFSAFNGNMTGQIFAMFSIGIAASEAAIGLAIVLAIFRNMAIVHSDDIKNLRG